MPGVVFTLERLNWRSATAGWLRLPGADRLQSFVDRAEAEASLRDREWELRRRINPFRCGGPYLHYQTTFDAARLHDWFLDAGLDPPGPTADSRAWAAMWDRDFLAMTYAQRAAAWEALDRVRFFRIEEGPPARPLHLVAQPHFEEDPIERPYGNYRYVGASPYMLVRRTQTADDLCHQLYVDRIVREGGYVNPDWELQPWTRPDRDPFDDAQTADPELYAEHGALDLQSSREPIPGQTVYVVLRRHWRLEVPDEGTWCCHLTSARPSGRAVLAYDTLAAADAHIARLEAEARTYPSPFRFGTPHEWGTLHASGIYGVLSDLAPLLFTNLWHEYKAPDALWSRWWDGVAPTLTAEEIVLAWSLFENLRFYEVVAVEYRD